MVLDAFQRRFILGLGGGTAQGQYTGSAIPAAGNLGRVGKGQHVLSAHVAADGDRGRFHIGVIDIHQGKRAIDYGRCIPFREGQRAARTTENRRIVDTYEITLAKINLTLHLDRDISSAITVSVGENVGESTCFQIPNAVCLGRCSAEMKRRIGKIEGSKIELV